MDQAHRGAKALEDSNFSAAIQWYTQALAVNPHATDYYIKRSTAYSRLKAQDGGPNGEAALHDAEMAVALGVQRGRRELILAGQMRRGIVLYQLERFGDADYVFQFMRSKLGPPEGSTQSNEANVKAAMAASGDDGARDKSKYQELPIWEMKVKGRLAKLESGDEKAKVTVKEVPDIEVGDVEELKKVYQAQSQENSNPSVTKPSASVSASGNASKPVAESKKEPIVQPPASTQPPTTDKVRHEWYQTSETVVITLYAKGVPKDKADIDIQDTSLSISFPLASGSDFSFNLEPLFAAIDPSSSKASVMSTKIEIVLRKQQSSQKWPALEDPTTGSKPAGENDGMPAKPTISSRFDIGPGESAAKAPAYPTSSKTGAKDWDKVASALTKKKKEKQSTSGKAKADSDSSATEPGDDDGVESDTSEYGGGDQVDSFFKKLYANSDPDTQRAMVKSFYESDGTSLSTNWNEVGKGKVTPKHD